MVIYTHLFGLNTGNEQSVEILSLVLVMSKATQKYLIKK